MAKGEEEAKASKKGREGQNKTAKSWKLRRKHKQRQSERLRSRETGRSSMAKGEEEAKASKKGREGQNKTAKSWKLRRKHKQRQSERLRSR